MQHKLVQTYFEVKLFESTCRAGGLLIVIKNTMSRLVLSVSQLLFQLFHLFSQPDVMCRCLLHTSHHAAHASIIVEMELFSDANPCFTGQAPASRARVFSRCPIELWHQDEIAPRQRIFGNLLSTTLLSENSVWYYRTVPRTSGINHPRKGLERGNGA